MKLLKMEHKKLYAMITMLAVVVVIVSVTLLSGTVMANDCVKREKTVVTVEVKEGDSLWSIASEYYTEDYKDMNSYIDEIKRTNGLRRDTIHSGCYLIIPCYERG